MTYPTPFKFGAISGIDLRVDISALLLATLIIFSGYNNALIIISGIGTMGALGIGVTLCFLFLLSILLHELGHALTGQAYGMQFGHITLHLMGGVAATQSEWPNPKVELLVAAAGPIVSLVLAAFCIALNIFFPEILLLNNYLATPLGFIIGYMGTMNLMLGLFNLIPAFPLDGGRILHSIIWKINGSRWFATRIAAETGYAFCIFLVVQFVLGMVGLPTLPFFNGGWNLMLAWLIYSMAKAEEQRANQ